MAKPLLCVLDRLKRPRAIVLVGGSAEDKAAFAGRDVYDFADLLARERCDLFVAPHRAKWMPMG